MFTIKSAEWLAGYELGIKYLILRVLSDYNGREKRRPPPSSALAVYRMTGTDARAYVAGEHERKA